MTSDKADKGTLKLATTDDGYIDAVYQSNDGVILSIENPENYEADTYEYIHSMLGADAANEIKKARSKWLEIAEYGIDFTKGFVMVPVDLVVSVVDGYVMIGELLIDIADGSLQKDLSLVANLNSKDKKRYDC